MRTLRCEPPDLQASDIVIGEGVTAPSLAAWLERTLPDRAAVALCDTAVARAHDERIGAIDRIEIDGGESAKTLAVVETLLRQLAQRRLDRRTVLVAFGGGSIGDLGGLVASLFLRGVTLVQVPTSLLAMVDSSVGGKTAVNLPEGKNLAGTYWAAEHVLIDPALLRSLSVEEYRSGLGEVLKVGIGLSAELFEVLESDREDVLRRDPATLETVIALAIRAKIRIVEADALESGPRRLLNLGHTVGHALEAASGFAIAHGIAVARGLHCAIEMATERGLLDAASAARCERLLIDYGFDKTPLPDAAELREFISRDKKAEGDAVHFVFPTGIGSSTAVSTPVAEVVSHES